MGLAVALSAGATLRHLGLSPPELSLTPLLLLPLLPLTRPGLRVRAWPFLVTAALAGWLHADAWARARSRDCRLLLTDGDSLEIHGPVTGAWGRGVVVDAQGGLPGGCGGELRVALRRDEAAPSPGVRVRVRGRWRSWGHGTDPDRAGELRGRVESEVDGAGPSRGLPRWRESVRERLTRLFPERHGLVAALVLARREGVDPALRTSFTRAGVAHLLAISGFHVGIVAALVLGLLRAGGARRRPAAVAGAAAVGAYVVFIGAPDAAVRAALLLGLVGAGVVRGRPVHRAGALATGLLLFVVGDPGAPTRPGFQLSFLGAAGLVFLAPVLDRALVRRVRWTRGRGPREAVAVGIAATLATLPAVAWHFGEVSAVGIPTTLAGTPLVAVAIPGILATLAADALPLVPAAVAHFLAGGTDLLLGALVQVVGVTGALPWATVAVPRGLLVAGAVGSAAGAIVLPPARDVGRDVRLATTGLGALGAAVLLGPLGAVLAGGGLEIVALDVGQGDAVALRSPAGRWLLVDAGPPAPSDSRAPPPAVARLRARGVSRLEGLLLTHPDLDHIGGAAAAIETFGPRFVGGPGHVRGTDAYVDGLERAGGKGHGIPWLELRAGDRLDLDGVEIRVLHPADDPAPGDEPNASSLVLLVTWGGFRGLLTGDAPTAVEDRLAGVAGDVDVLKVAHHGSRTSTSRAFLDVVLPEVALVSAGRHNRYGHPHAEVLERLGSVSGRLLRTDRDGTLRVLVRRDGSWRVRTGSGWLGR